MHKILCAGYPGRETWILPMYLPPRGIIFQSSSWYNADMVVCVDMHYFLYIHYNHYYLYNSGNSSTVLIFILCSKLLWGELAFTCSSSVPAYRISLQLMKTALTSDQTFKSKWVCSLRCVVLNWLRMTFGLTTFTESLLYPASISGPACWVHCRDSFFWHGDIKGICCIVHSHITIATL